MSYCEIPEPQVPTQVRILPFLPNKNFLQKSIDKLKNLCYTKYVRLREGNLFHAGMVEQADTTDLKSVAVWRAGSSPATRTIEWWDVTYPAKAVNSIVAIRSQSSVKTPSSMGVWRSGSARDF